MAHVEYGPQMDDETRAAYHAWLSTPNGSTASSFRGAEWAFNAAHWMGKRKGVAAERAKLAPVIEAARDASEYWRIEGGDVVGFEQLMKRLDATLRAAGVDE